MTVFRQKVLGLLDRVYMFVGQESSTNRLDLAAPIQLVHDVSRQAERGTGVGNEDGFFVGDFLCPCAGIGTYDEIFDLYDVVLGPAGFDVVDRERDYRLWILNFSARCDSGDSQKLDYWAASVSQDAAGMRLNVSTEDPVWVLGSGISQPAIDYPRFRDYGSQLGAVPPMGGVDGEGATMPGVKLPLFVPPPASLCVQVKTTAAVGAHGFLVNVMGWVGKKGCTPPGLG